MGLHLEVQCQGTKMREEMACWQKVVGSLERVYVVEEGLCTGKAEAVLGSPWSAF